MLMFSHGNYLLGSDFISEETYGKALARHIATAPRIPLKTLDCDGFKQKIIEVSQAANRCVHFALVELIDLTFFL